MSSPSMNNYISTQNAIDLLRTLEPLSGWTFQHSGKKISVDAVIDALRSIIADRGSLEAIVDGGNSRTAQTGDSARTLDEYDFFADGTTEAAFSQIEDREQIAPYLDLLTEQERTVVDLRYGLTSGDPLGWKEIGQRLGMTGQAANAAHTRAMQRMKSGKPARRSPGSAKESAA